MKAGFDWHSLTLRIRCYDRQLLDDTAIGQVLIPLCELPRLLGSEVGMGNVGNAIIKFSDSMNVTF